MSIADIFRTPHQASERRRVKPDPVEEERYCIAERERLDAELRAWREEALRTIPRGFAAR